MYKILVADSLPAEILEKYNKSKNIQVDNKSGISKEELAEISTFLERTYGLSVTVEAPHARHQAPGTTVPVEEKQQNPESEPQKEMSFDPYEDEYVDVLDVLNSSPDKKNGKKPLSGDADFVDIIGTPEKKPALRYDDIGRNAAEDYVDYISSLGIPLDNGKKVTLPVNLQTGSIVNLIVSAKERTVMEILRKGTRVEKVELNSPISINTGNCIVTSVSRIDMGPKKGDYSIDLKIEG